MSDVWVIESGEYEQRFVNAVASSPEAALEYLRNLYSHPYVVTWEPLVKDGEDYSITGHFEAETGFSIKHTCVYSLTKYELDGVRATREEVEAALRIEQQKSTKPSAVKREESECPTIPPY